MMAKKRRKIELSSELEEELREIFDVMGLNEDWIRSNKEDLLRLYNDQYIAVKKQVVIAHNESHDELLSEIRTMYSLASDQAIPNDIIIQPITDASPRYLY
jgi:hypothetical protein